MNSVHENLIPIYRRKFTSTFDEWYKKRSPWAVFDSLSDLASLHRLPSLWTILTPKPTLRRSLSVGDIPRSPVRVERYSLPGSYLDDFHDYSETCTCYECFLIRHERDYDDSEGGYDSDYDYGPYDLDGYDWETLRCP